MQVKNAYAAPLRLAARGLSAQMAGMITRIALVIGHGEAQSISTSKTAVGANSIAFSDSQQDVVEDDSIRPYHIQIPEEQLADLRHRLSEVRWPDQETALN